MSPPYNKEKAKQFLTNNSYWLEVAQSVYKVNFGVSMWMTLHSLLGCSGKKGQVRKTSTSSLSNSKS